jgi:hypothetical protein
MKQEDFIRKLENLETPEIELPGHRQSLRAALLNSGCFKEKTGLGWAKMLAPVAAAVVLILVVGFFNLIQPQLQIAQAKDIARNDPYVQALMDEHNLGIAEVKIQDGEAFVVLAPQPSGLLGSESLCQRSAHIVSQILRWAWRSATDEASFSPHPSEEDLRLPDDELSPGYILQIDLLDKNVSGFGQIDEVAPLGEINMEGIEFVKLGPPEDAGPEETDPK